MSSLTSDSAGDDFTYIKTAWKRDESCEFTFAPDVKCLRFDPYYCVDCCLYWTHCCRCGDGLVCAGIGL